MDPKRFLVVGLGRIGDLVLLTPVFRALKQDNPSNQVHLLASHINHQVVRPHPYIDRVYVESFHPLKNMRLLYQLRSGNYDWWIDPKDHKSGTSRYYLIMASRGRSIGFNEPRFRRFTYGVKPLREQFGIHIADRFLQALQPVDIINQDNRPVLEVGKAEASELDKFCKVQRLHSYFFINISSSRPQREWPVDKWIEFLTRISHMAPGFLISSAPHDKEKAHLIAKQLENGHFYPTRSIKDVSAALSGSDMVLTVDTAVVHIAAAFNKPLLGLYMNTYREYTKYFPLSEVSKCVFAEEENANVDQISVDRAFDEFVELRRKMGRMD